MPTRVRITAPERLSPGTVVEMETLYRRYYTGAAQDTFRRDLSQKDLVILLLNGDSVAGFSTQKLVAMPDGARILFSGDTVVDASDRRQFGLAGAFGHIMLRLTRNIPDKPRYWFLISKGARTYRFLPTFFRVYVPSHESDPGLLRLRDAVAVHFFPREWVASKGILHFEGSKDRLISDELRDDPESVLFRRLNPGWADGDELCCLAPISLENLNSRAERVIRAVEPEWDLP